MEKGLNVGAKRSGATTFALKACYLLLRGWMGEKYCSTRYMGYFYNFIMPSVIFLIRIPSIIIKTFLCNPN